MSLAHELVAAIAQDPEALADLRDLLGVDAVASPWLTADEAAEHLRCPVSRVRKLTMAGDLPVSRDGRRTLYNRAELDAFLARGGARTP